MINNIPKACKITIYENAIYIDNANSLWSGSFYKYFTEEIVPYCEENNIKHIYLSDGQSSGKDVWGYKYGFSGRYRCGTRHLYLPFIGCTDINTVIELLTGCKYRKQNIEKDMIVECFCDGNVDTYDKANEFINNIDIEKLLNNGKLIKTINNYN